MAILALVALFVIAIVIDLCRGTLFKTKKMTKSRSNSASKETKLQANENSNIKYQTLSIEKKKEYIKAAQEMYDNAKTFRDEAVEKSQNGSSIYDKRLMGLIENCVKNIKHLVIECNKYMNLSTTKVSNEETSLFRLGERIEGQLEQIQNMMIANGLQDINNKISETFGGSPDQDTLTTTNVTNNQNKDGNDGDDGDGFDWLDGESDDLTVDEVTDIEELLEDDDIF